MFDEQEIMQILSNLDALARDKVQIQILKMYFTDSPWNVYLEKKTDGVELKVTEKADNLMEALDGAIQKWNRITGTVTEFRGPLLETTAQRLDDEIPF